MFKSISFTIFALLVFTNITLHAQDKNIKFPRGVTIEKQSFFEENKAKMFQLEAEYPRIVGLDRVAQDRFNKEIEKLVMGRLNEFRKRMLEYTAEDLKHTKKLGITNYSEIHYVVELANEGFISVFFDNSTYSGGAHPNSESFTVNFDLKRGNRIELRDLFQSNSEYLKRVSDYSVADLKRQQSDFSDSDWIKRGAGPTAKNFRSWNVTEKGLRINFDPYQVAAYAAGPQEVLIPYSVLKDIFRAISFEPIHSVSYVDGNPPNWCRNGHFPRDNVEFKLARVVGKRKSRAHFFRDKYEKQIKNNCFYG